MLFTEAWAIALTAVTAVSASRVKRSDFGVKDVHVTPKHWTKLGRAPKEQLLNLNIGLKQGNFAELERHLFEGVIKTPSSLICHRR